MPDWRARATRLVADLIALGVLDDPRWVTAFRETPRHLFVPRWLRQEENGCWHPVAHDDPATAAEWAERTYTDAPLVTAVDATGAPISSSSQPSLMAQMLTALDVTDDARVLEIGIGTGYDAALLCHRLRDEQVHSIDVEPALTEIARERLAALGHAPRLATRDGVTGWPQPGPYDRIVATCAVARIPPAWAEQLQPGGLVLADLKIGAGSGNLVLLRAGRDGLLGRFHPTSVGFMPLRSPAVPARRPAAPRGSGEPRPLDPAAVPPLSPAETFFAALGLPGNHLSHDVLLDRVRHTPSTDRYVAEDGSWVEIDRGADHARCGGGTPLLDLLLDAHARYEGLGRPAWERFTLTVAPDGTHIVALDQRAAWTLPR